MVTVAAIAPVFVRFFGNKLARKVAWLCAGSAAHVQVSDSPPLTVFPAHLAFGPVTCLKDFNPSAVLNVVTAVTLVAFTPL